MREFFDGRTLIPPEIVNSCTQHLKPLLKKHMENLGGRPSNDSTDTFSLGVLLFTVRPSSRNITRDQTTRPFPKQALVKSESQKGLIFPLVALAQRRVSG